MKAVILAVGDELVSGQTVDTNSAHLAGRLAGVGIRTIAHRTVGDDRGAIASAIREAAARADVVLVSGGLGPTADDLTRHGLAEAMSCELVLDADCLATIEAFFRARGRKMIPANRVQAMIPAGAEPLPNELGTAPGVAATVGKASVFVLPGVPSEMREMFERSVVPRLPGRGGVRLHRVLHTFGAGESDIGATISDLMAREANPLVGTTAKAGLVSVRITAQGDDEQSAEHLAAETANEVRRRLGRLVVGEGEQTMASVVGELLLAAGQTLATAESCTGGLIGEMITAVPGASRYYLGGLVAYADAVKQNALGVDADLLAADGAVSEPVAAAMAAGCRERFAADWALAVTGIAGPTGGSSEKPVGLVYIALAGPEGAGVQRHVFPGTRSLIRRRTALAGLNELRLCLLRGSTRGPQ